RGAAAHSNRQAHENEIARGVSELSVSVGGLGAARAEANIEWCRVRNGLRAGFAMRDAIDRAGLPSYARFVDDRRGRWRRLALSLMLRMTVKRQWRPDVDVVQLREQQAAFDVKFGVLDRE